MTLAYGQGEEFTAHSVTRTEALQEIEELFCLHDESAAEVALVRHAEPAASSSAGPDPLLSCAGLAQAERLAERLAGCWFEAVYSAPERRALQTATLIAKVSGRPMITLGDLREIDFNSRDEVGPGCPAHSFVQRFLANPRWDALPGFAPSRSFRRRAIQAIDAVVCSHPGERAVIVTHSSLINAYLGMVLEVPRDLFFSPGYASISWVRALGELYTVRGLNDVAHLLGAGNEGYAGSFNAPFTAVNSPLTFPA